MKSSIRRNQTVTFSRIDRNSIKFIRILFQNEKNRIIVIEGKDMHRVFLHHCLAFLSMDFWIKHKICNPSLVKLIAYNISGNLYI